MEADDRLLQGAMRNLERFVVVGITERFDESLMLLRARLGWHWPLYRAENQNPRTVKVHDLPTGVVSAIAALNAYDMELYRWAQERLQGQLAVLGRRLGLELRAFRMLNVGPARRAQGLCRRVAVVRRRLLAP